MVKLLTVEDYRKYQNTFHKILIKIMESMDYPVHCYQIDNDWVFDNAQLQSSDVVLDVGCGYFSSTIQAAYFAKEVYAIDIEEHLSELTKRKKGMKNNIKFCQCNAKEMPFENELFDKIISISSIEHNTQEDRKLLMKECHRVLKIDGTMTFSIGIGEKYLTSEKEILDFCLGSGFSLVDNTLLNWDINSDFYKKIYQDWVDELGYDQHWIPCGIKLIKE